jgi:Ca2+-binding RTX toxin-like protein
MDGGAGFDVATYEGNTTPVWADLRLGTVRFPGQPWGVEHLVSIEAVYGGSAGDTLIGDGAANMLRGGVGADRILGGLGADTLIGNTGQDQLDGGQGADNLLGGLGNDTLHGRAGNDEVDAGSGVNVAYGGIGNDTIRGGTDGAERLFGGAGDDVIYGHGAESDDDVINTELLSGGAGNDTIYGGAWEASILTMSGGAGDDVFVLGERIGQDPDLDWLYIDYYVPATITDFESGDVIRFDLDPRGALGLSGDPLNLRFVGEVEDPLDMDKGGVGYMRDGDSTRVFVMEDQLGFGDGQQYIDITLTGYQGDLTAGNFDLG